MSNNYLTWDEVIKRNNMENLTDENEIAEIRRLSEEWRLANPIEAAAIEAVDYAVFEEKN